MNPIEVIDEQIEKINKSMTFVCAKNRVLKEGDEKKDIMNQILKEYEQTLHELQRQKGAINPNKKEKNIDLHNIRTLMKACLHAAIQNSLLFIICKSDEMQDILHEFEREGITFSESETAFEFAEKKYGTKKIQTIVEEYKDHAPFVKLAINNNYMYQVDYEWMTNKEATMIQFNDCCEWCNINPKSLRKLMKKIYHMPLEKVTQIYKDYKDFTEFNRALKKHAEEKV